MTSPKKNQEPLGTYAEAMRYVENAKECLKKAGKAGDFYLDEKYVKMAGNTLWNGVLFALRTKFPVKGRPDIIKYRQEIGKVNKTMLRELNAGYELCHLVMGYDGHLKVNVCKEGVKSALKLIEWAAPD
jgi:hypothetical protein